MTDEYRALVCITTCLRLGRLKRYLPHYAAFCQRDRRFHLLVALDGDEAGYRTFSEEWRIPLVWSDRREGVGMSKNRVLERFPDFDYYFFLDDDVELVDGSAFPTQVALARESGIHHFALFQRGGVRKPVGESVVAGHRIVHGLYGGGQLGFYTREGLARVGGWHPDFAEVRRWGHTEHSHRFPRVGLAPAPFNVAEDLADAFLWHYPPPVTRMSDVPTDEDQISPLERELIDRGLEHVPVRTLASHHFNDQPFHALDRLAGTLDGGGRYPLVPEDDRRRAVADFLLWRARTGRGLARRVTSLLRSALLWPSNPMLRHTVKRALGGRR